jgi:hypothetical protein
MEQQKIRRQWLILMLASMGFASVSIVLNFFYSSLKEILPAPYLYAPAIFGIVVGVGFNYLFYRCAYKKPGTRILTFLLFYSPLATVYSSYTLYNTPLEVIQIFPFFWTIGIIGTILSVWMYVLHWKLRKVNIELKNAN